MRTCSPRHSAALVVLLTACSSESGGGSSGEGGGEPASSASTSGATTSASVATTSSTSGAGGEGGAGAGSSSGGGGSGGTVEVSPSPEECEQFTTETDCLGAGCRLFVEVIVAEPGSPDVCSDATGGPREMCFQLDPEQTWAHPAGGILYRERNGEIEEILMHESFCGLLGWERCSSAEPGATPTPLCTCIVDACG
jgi:hypothetical protein